MPLNFPPVSDVQYENAPLIAVVCQVRFPPILRIVDEAPSAFQELIRNRFPQLQLEHGVVIRVPRLGSQAAPEAEPPTKTYRFWTPDERMTVSLAVDFYALSTTNYKHWADFAAHLDLAHQAIQKVYAPTYATRVGLRYINRFTPANTGCQMAAELFDFLRPELTAQSRSEAWTDPVEMRSRLLLTDNNAKFNLSTRYGEEAGEPFLILDFDYFEEGQLSLEDVVERCTRYNNIIYRAFCWCVREEKLSVFKPKAKEAPS